MYYAGQSASQEPPSLRNALATIHRDRGWWHKMLVGGLLTLTGIGAIAVEGYQLESLDNTRNGFPTPLPLWRDWSLKFIQGIFGFVIDFFFFVFPVMLGGMLLGCSAIAQALLSSTALIQPLSLIVSSAVLLWLAAMWLLGVSPIAKQLYANEGLPREALSGKPIRMALTAPGRSVYFRARLQSVPVYLLTCAGLGLGWYALRWNTWLGLAGLWLGLALLCYTRLITIQLYQAATQQLEHDRFQQRRRAKNNQL